MNKTFKIKNEEELNSTTVLITSTESLVINDVLIDKNDTNIKYKVIGIIGNKYKLQPLVGTIDFKELEVFKLNS